MEKVVVSSTFKIHKQTRQYEFIEVEAKLEATYDIQENQIEDKQLLLDSKCIESVSKN